jgi:hypothetical protein
MAYSKPRTLNIPWKVMVVRADPDFEAAKRNEVFYQFSNGRTFRGNPATHGAYSNETPDNPTFD